MMVVTFIGTRITAPTALKGLTSRRLILMNSVWPSALIELIIADEEVAVVAVEASRLIRLRSAEAVARRKAV
jgi:hypothetical protein